MSGSKASLGILVDAAILVMVIVVLLWGHLILADITGTDIPLAVVDGRSMLPLLREGDLVLLKGEKPDNIHVGDIIVYRSRYGNRLIIHRVIGVLEKKGTYYYRVKGDNNPVEDYQEYEMGIGVPYDRVVGKVVEAWGSPFKIPYLGFFSLLLRR